jgi:hypothetical protein
VLDWTDEHKMLRDAIRSFVDKVIVPLRDELAHGDLAPCGVLRELFAAFGIDEMARDSFKKRLERDVAPRPTSPDTRSESSASGFDPEPTHEHVLEPISVRPVGQRDHEPVVGRYSLHRRFVGRPVVRRRRVGLPMRSRPAFRSTSTRTVSWLDRSGGRH